MAFHEIQFPTSISQGSSGGPTRLTDIVELRGGGEERNSVWANSRRKYDAGMGMRSIDDLHAVLVFFEARKGRLHGFRWKDWSDYKSCPPNKAVSPTDQLLGVGDGSRREFQLQKLYEDLYGSWTRLIKKPVPGTVRAGLNGAETSAFSLNTTTGLLTLDEIPSSGVQVTAGFEFDVPVRFMNDSISVNVQIYLTGEIPDVSVIEIRV